jgi:RNA recognition motif-containing protein
MSSSPTFEGCNLFVASLPPGTDDERLRAMFTPFGSIVSAKVMVDLKSKMLRNHGFVRFLAPDEAAAAIHAMHKRKLDEFSAPIHVALSTHNDTDKSVECEVVYVRNLPDNVTVEQLRQVFARFGQIVDVLLPTYNNSAHQGVGFVRFSSVDEARAAVTNAHNTAPFGGGKAIQVRFKESKQMSVRRGATKSRSETGSPPMSGASSPAYRSQMASPNDPSLVNHHSPHNFSLSMPSPGAQPIPPLSPGAMVLVPIALSTSPQASPPQSTHPGFGAMPTAAPIQPLPPAPIQTLMQGGPMPQHGSLPQQNGSPITYSLAPASSRPFPSDNDLYFANFGSRDWLLEVLRPWQPRLLQPHNDGTAMVRLHDEAVHFSAAQSLNGVMTPTGLPLTVALVRV